ncbi:hypothetical protein VNO77_07633 [Canavalia gladiata]|uniref:Uncharacterized protein n=1 Tax=Canavalia gladiata TaxID=3824 RepID=A0AAN9M8K2_CANGL
MKGANGPLCKSEGHTCRSGPLVQINAKIPFFVDGGIPFSYIHESRTSINMGSTDKYYLIDEVAQPIKYSDNPNSRSLSHRKGIAQVVERVSQPQSLGSIPRGGDFLLNTIPNVSINCMFSPSLGHERGM